MAEEKQGTTNMRTGRIAQAKILTAPEDALAAGEGPAAVVETIPEIATHKELLTENSKRWPL